MIGGRICGHVPPASFISSSHEVVIRFRSDRAKEKNGYKIIVEEIGKINYIFELSNSVANLKETKIYQSFLTNKYFSFQIQLNVIANSMMVALVTTESCVWKNMNQRTI